MKKGRMWPGIGLVIAMACLSLSMAVVGQTSNGAWNVTAAAPSSVIPLPATAQMSVSIKNTSAGFAWVTLTRPDGTTLEHRIDPQSSMTLFGKFTGVVVKYHVPRGSQPKPANGTWTTVGVVGPAPVALMGNGTWYVDPNINGTATIYVSDVVPTPTVEITVTNSGPDVVTVLIKLANGTFQRIPVPKNAIVTIPPQGAQNWSILEVIVEWKKGGKSTGAYTVNKK
jgi:hypothetical protein